MENNLIKYWASLITESDDMMTNDTEKLTTISNLIEEVVEKYKNLNNNFEAPKDQIVKQGSEIFASMETEEMNKILVDYTTHLIDSTEVDLDSNDSINNWLKTVNSRLTALWFMIFYVLEERGLLLKKLYGPTAGFAPEWLMDYVESVGGYSFKKIRTVDGHRKISFPKAKDISRYLSSPHRTL